MRQAGAGGLLVLLAVTAHTHAVADTSKGGPRVSLRGGGSVTTFFRRVSPPPSVGLRVLSGTHAIILLCTYNDNMTCIYK